MTKVIEDNELDWKDLLSQEINRDRDFFQELLIRDVLNGTRFTQVTLKAKCELRVKFAPDTCKLTIKKAVAD